MLGLGVEGRAHGWVAGKGMQAFGCPCYCGLGSASPAPRFLATLPPYATQALANNYCQKYDGMCMYNIVDH